RPRVSGSGSGGTLRLRSITNSTVTCSLDRRTRGSASATTRQATNAVRAAMATHFRPFPIPVRLRRPPSTTNRTTASRTSHHGRTNSRPRIAPQTSATSATSSGPTSQPSDSSITAASATARWNDHAPDHTSRASMNPSAAAETANAIQRADDIPNPKTEVAAKKHKSHKKEIGQNQAPGFNSSLFVLFVPFCGDHSLELHPLHAVVLGVNHMHPAAAVHGQRPGAVQLPRLAARRAPRPERLPLRRELLHPLVAVL